MDITDYTTVPYQREKNTHIQDLSELFGFTKTCQILEWVSNTYHTGGRQHKRTSH